MENQHRGNTRLGRSASQCARLSAAHRSGGGRPHRSDFNRPAAGCDDFGAPSIRLKTFFLMNERPRAHSPPALILAVLGIVFGDIGTSPLYALKEAFHPDHGIALNTSSVFGVLSLLCWAIVMVVAVKYVWFIMRADNHGEGGPLALMALGLSRIPRQSKAAARMLMLGLFGACMFYGDAAIAPAISVLSAVEGLHIAAPHLSALVLPITLLILTVLFAIQRYGAQTVGALFGPVMLLWFITLAALGLWQIAHAPAILGALNPVHALRFMSSQPRL